MTESLMLPAIPRSREVCQVLLRVIVAGGEMLEVRPTRTYAPNQALMLEADR